MLNVKKIVTIFLTATLLIACKKSAPENNNGATLLFKQNINNIKKNEPVSLTFGNDSSSTNVVWTISPNINSTAETIANNITVSFSQVGVYTVTATSGNVYAQYIITIVNIDYVPDYGTDFGLTASKLVGINQNEPVVFSVHNPVNSNTLVWTALTSNTSIHYTKIQDNINNRAIYTFTGNGYAIIVASDGINYQRRTVVIGSGHNSSSLLDTSNFMLGDKLQLTPSVTNNGKTLQIAAQTIKKYNCSSDNILSFNLNNDYQIDYSGVSISPTTCNERGAATCINGFKNMQVGTHNFAINFGNKTYTGKINLSSTGIYTFTWQNGGDVNISPLIVH